MRLTLMVLNAAGEVLGFHESALRGDSPGWSNSLATLRFTQRQDYFALATDAALLRVIFNSGTWDTRAGASHPTVGFAAIYDCRLWVQDREGRRTNIWPNSDFSLGENLDEPTGQPLGWTRSTMGRSIPQVIQIPQFNHSHALALVDDNFRNGGEWRVQPWVFGSLRERDIGAIWNDAAFRSFRERVLGYRFPFCFDCGFALCDYVAAEDFEQDWHLKQVSCGACLWCTGLFHCLV